MSARAPNLLVGAERMGTALFAAPLFAAPSKRTAFPASPLMWWTALFATLHCATALVVSPSPSLSPVDVVTSQMTALQKGDVRAAFEFASPANRVNTGPWQNFEMMVRQTPAYSPLVQCSSFEVVGALPFGDERMRCRVRVKPAGSSSAPFAVADPVCIFNWSLSKQTTKRWPDDPLLGCWMVDGVMPE